MMFSGKPRIKPEHNLLVRGARRLLPVATESEEPRFFLWRNGKLFATPILLTLVFIEATDVLFAIDSVPAIFAITREPLVVYTSNVFALFWACARCVFCWPVPLQGFTCCALAWRSFSFLLG
jgi:tellurite resistance protein TerC